eukprot:5548920-Prymnesium_polylepis.1
MLRGTLLAPLRSARAAPHHSCSTLARPQEATRSYTQRMAPIVPVPIARGVCARHGRRRAHGSIRAAPSGAPHVDAAASRPVRPLRRGIALRAA